MTELIPPTSAAVRATPPRWLRFNAAREHFAVRALMVLVRRLLGLVCVLLVVVTAVFLMVQLIPGDPLAGDGDVTAAQLEQLRAQYGLDQPLLTQYTDYLSNVAHGDLGRSLETQQPVSQLIGERLGTSLELAAGALVLVLGIGLPLGIVAGALTREGRRRRLEFGFMSFTSVMASIPNYLTATVLVFLFAVQLTIFPVAGAGTFLQLVLPVIAVALAPMLTLSRIVRVETLDVLSQDYIRTARSQRLPTRMIYLRHVFPNVLTAALTIGGVIFAEVIGGAVIIENVFARPGLGKALVDAVLTKNYPVVQGVTLVLGAAVVIINSLVDIVLDALDPNVRSR